MKTTLATTLSLVGVLGAGAAAALVNTSIFDSTPTEAAASSAFIPEAATVDLTLPPSAEITTATTTVEAPVTAAQSTGTSEIEGAAPAPVSSRVVGAEEPTVTTVAPTPTTVPAAPVATTTPPTTTPPTAAPTTTVPASYLTTFNVGGAGTVTVDVISSRILVLDTSAAPGWTVVKTEAYPARNAVEVEFTDGAVEVTFEATFDTQLGIVPELSSREVTPPAPPRYDDDDDDDYDDDDHDDDHDDDDDDDHDHDDDDDERDDD